MLRRAALSGLAVAGAGAGYVAATDADARVAVTAALNDNSGGVIRFGRTVSNALLTAADYKVSLYGKDKETDEAAYKEALSGANLRAAKRLYRVCHRNGGLYTKFGQGVANLNHALPEEFTDILAPLQDRAREMSPELAMQTLREELGDVEVSDVFSTFEKLPLAAASLAQVHRATLRSTGEQVAVKLQYPYLRNQTKGDLATLRMLTDFVGYWFPDFSYSWLTPEFADNMVLELDFVQEARNGERLARMFQRHADVYVPRIHWPHTTARMLVMEYIEGVKITKVDDFAAQGIHPLEVATTVSALFGDMIHVHGFAHCDPHPGNLLVRPAPPRPLWSSAPALLLSLACYAGAAATAAAAPMLGPAAPAVVLALCGCGAVASLESLRLRGRVKRFGGRRGAEYQVVVLDHGMYRRLDPDFRRNYCMLWKALLLQDPVLGRRAAEGLGVSGEAYDAFALVFTFRSSTSTGPAGQRMSKEERLRVRDQYKHIGAGDVNRFLESLPRDLLFVMRATNIVRSINLALGGSSRLRFRTMGESAVRGLLVPNPPPEELAADRARPEAARAARGQQLAAVPAEGAYTINLPVTSEVVDAETITTRQAFEMWRLRTYLLLIDTSWAIVARAVQMM